MRGSEWRVPAGVEVKSGSREGRRDSNQRVLVVVTVSERPAPLDEFYREYAGALRAHGVDFEFVFVAGAEYVHHLDELETAHGEEDELHLIRAGQVLGEAALVERALEERAAGLVLTMPSYHRVEADALPQLLDRLKEGADVAVARRSPRRDPWPNRLQTALFHGLLHGVAGGHLDDVACGVRAIRREVLDRVPLYGDFFRFFPLFAEREGYEVVQVDAPQHPRDSGTRIYGPGIYLRRLIDLLAVFFLLRFTWKPLRFFGLVGSGLAGAGGLVLLTLFIQRIGGQGIADRPLLLLGLLLVVLGVQAIALGLIGEIIVHLHAPSRRKYRVVEGAPSESDDGG